MTENKHIISILTIAGSDCSGGAGIQADIRAAAMRGVFATSAVTAVTAQNSHGVSDTVTITPSTVVSQLEAVFTDMPPRAIKIGMLGSVENGLAVAKFLTERAEGIPIIVDPVMTATTGGKLTDRISEMKDFYIRELAPLATVVTPNINEALGFGVEQCGEIEMAISLLRLLNPGAVVLKGGHSPANLISDVVAISQPDGSVLTDKTTASKIKCHNLHGTGCTFSSIMAAEMSKGESIREAFITTSWVMKDIIAKSRHYTLGTSSYGPLNMFDYHIN